MSHVHLYGRTKLAMILGVKYGLVERVIKPNGDNIYALSVHPGVVGTLPDWIVNTTLTQHLPRSTLICKSNGKPRTLVLRVSS